MSTTATRHPTTGFTREGVAAFAMRTSRSGCAIGGWRRGISTNPCRCPQRTDEEWRRTDLRALKLDRFAPFAGIGEHRRRRSDGVVDGRSARARDAGRHRRAARCRRPSSRSQSGARRQGRDLHRSRHRGRAARGAGPAILHDPGGAGQLRQVRGAARRASGRAARSSMCRRASRSSCRSARSRSRHDAGAVDLHPHADRARGARRGIPRRCLPARRRRRTAASPRAWSS